MDLNFQTIHQMKRPTKRLLNQQNANLSRFRYVSSYDCIIVYISHCMRRSLYAVVIVYISHCIYRSLHMLAIACISNQFVDLVFL